MDKMREEFEFWAISELGYNERLGDGYKDREVNSSWMAWQASRAVLCVELPNEEVPGRFDGDGETGYVNGYNSSLSDVKEHLRFHGVTYK